MAHSALSPDGFPLTLLNGLETDNVKDVNCLQPLDQLLRCGICFDYLNVCMMTTCSHNYCSLCIRKYMTYKAQCPVCFEVTSEPELRNNRLIDDVVKHYKMLKATLHSCLRLSEDGKLPESDVKESSSEISIKGSSEKLAPGYDDKKSNSSKEELSNLDHSTISGTSITDLADACPESEEKEKVHCPVCSVAVLMENINSHLDMCLIKGERKKSLRRSSSERRKSLPKVVYHFMSDKELKKRLKDIGLSTSGDRQAMIKRHKAFLVLYNAECDSFHPRPVPDIIKQVEMEEKEEQTLNCQQPVFQFDKRSDQETIEIEREKYLSLHDNQFNRLISDIRRRKSQQEEKNQNSRNRRSSTIEYDVTPCSSSALPPDVNYNSTTQHDGCEINTENINLDEYVNNKLCLKNECYLPSDENNKLAHKEEDNINAAFTEEGSSNSKTVKKVSAPPPSPARNPQVIVQSRKRKNKEIEYHFRKR